MSMNDLHEIEPVVMMVKVDYERHSYLYQRLIDDAMLLWYRSLIS
jgi:hypothetical protein